MTDLEKTYTDEAQSNINMLTYKESGKISWQSPSNIAIVKYWGKKEIQLPRNPNLSFTLNACHTITSLSYEMKTQENKDISLKFYFDNASNFGFEKRIKMYLTSLLEYFPFLYQYNIIIKSSNSFPHSSGIASSASAMSALAMCLCTMESDIYGLTNSPSSYLKKASFMARLGSGSACRSLYPKAAIWGKSEAFEDSSDEYAISIEDILHPNFTDLRDSIIIVSDKVKNVSSSAGHRLMDNNPYAHIRYETATNHLIKLKEILKSGDWQAFGELAEQEALDLHALMMSSRPSYILMKPETLLLINKIRSIRQSTGLPMYFTLDAGPNIHLLYPKAIETKVLDIINKDLLPLVGEVRVIHDGVGTGTKIFIIREK